MIVVIGILAAIAIPKYQDLTLEAQKGVLRGAAGAAASASAVNLAKKLGSLPYTVVSDCTAFSTPSTLYDGPAGITASGTTNTTTASVCTFTNSVTSVTATGFYGAP